jgi:aerobic-type carbon monoxide dehydrogenase small subunit (CoxS/CutS family)
VSAAHPFVLRCAPYTILQFAADAMTDKVAVTLFVNGQRHDISVEPRKTLVDAIRDDCGLTGTHIGCEHGVCGACTVIIGHESVRSCLMFAVQAAGKRIRTVEGLARGNTLHPLQRAFVAHHGLQCGFCTPGFLMLAVNMLEQNPNIGEEEMLDVLASNLCRCTGYHNIVAAVRAAQAEMRPKDQAKPPTAAPAADEAPPTAELLEQAETAHE